MDLPIGGDMAGRDSSIIGIFDLDNTTWSARTRKFLRSAQARGEITETTMELPKSFLLTSEFGMNRIYFSQFSPSTLEKRLK